MSGSSYRLEAPRPRHPPPPLQFHDSSSRSSGIFSNDRNSPTLLYDLPSPTSSQRGKVTSPTSPTYASRSMASRGGRPTPPPSGGRNRSVTPLEVVPSELEEFADHCRAWYYKQDDNSGRLMTQILTHLPPSQRAPYSRLQASIRTAYHASVNARRNAEFQAHLRATQPGGSLMPHSRSNPNGPLARKERFERFERFVRSWCTMGLPGTRPFFEALWALMRLQVVPEKIGGAGGYRIEWECDDAVFKEAAGKIFMLEAIDVLKGVLGFEEAQSSKIVSSGLTFEGSMNASPHTRSQSQPLPSNKQKPTAINSKSVTPKRARAPSDPFLDTPSLSRPLVSTGSESSGNTTALLSSDIPEEPPSPALLDRDDPTPTPTRSHSRAGTGADFRSSVAFEPEETYLRIWTSPDLPNPEYLSLLKVFPSFITRRTMPRFPIAPRSRRHADIEEGDDEGNEESRIRSGTGSMWVGTKERRHGWEGGWWARLVMWWRRTFC